MTEGAEIEGRFTLEAMSDHAITVKGTITAPWTGECRRCLRTIEGTVSLDVEEVFDARPVEGETYPLDGDRLNVEPLVRDAVLLSLPLAPFCSGARSSQARVPADAIDADRPPWREPPATSTPAGRLSDGRLKRPATATFPSPLVVRR